MKNKLLIGLLVLSTAAISAKAISVNPTLELALCIDNSGSIGSANFALQRSGYVNALTALLPTDGTVAVGVWDFESANHLVFDERIIASAADKTALINAISGMAYIGGNTALGPSIVDAYTRLVQGDILGGRRVIDVSTDGVGNVGINQVTARDQALGAGIDQVNGLMVGTPINTSFVGGVGSFFETAATFADFQTALDRKLTHEIQGVPDAGSTLTLLGMGLVALATLRRRLA